MASDETIREEIRGAAVMVADSLSKHYGEHPGHFWAQALSAVCILDAAGLLAPAPMREEWGVRWDDGTQWTEGYKTRAEADVDLGPDDTIICRHVTDWETA